MTPLTLRDHAQAILEAVARDIVSPQTSHEQSEKSKGRAPVIPGAPETAAQTHAVLRARCGFDINQLVAEYRALRCSVLRLWMDNSELSAIDILDMIRFNEAIDQAVAESVSFFHTQVEQARDLLLGMLGHDMRSPLNTILMTASYLSALNAGQEVSAAAYRLIRSGASMQALLEDLVDFNRTRLGLGIRIRPSELDLASVIQDELDQLRGTCPDHQIELTMSGDLRGCWDGPRLQQVLRNLVSNASYYSSPGTAVRVGVRGQVEGICMEVVNHGRAISPTEIERIFDPLRRVGKDADTYANPAGLGLGLFIVREVTRAHRGDVQVYSNGNETAFVVRLPRYCGPRGDEKGVDEKEVDEKGGGSRFD
jgi:signal transduction histidine kinase